MRAKIAMASLTPQSATASETQSGASGPVVRNGAASAAHETSSFAATENSVAKVVEKASEKKMAVSTAEEMIEETSGARHQLPSRRRLNTATSRSCAARKAVAEAMATRNETLGAIYD